MSKIDLRRLSAAFVSAANYADELPYEIAFSVDEKIGALVVTGTLDRGTQVHSAATGGSLWAFMQDAETEFARAFRFIEASLGPIGRAEAE